MPTELPPDRDLQKKVNDVLWKACDTFRGSIDPSLYKEYLLTMLFLKYVSDRAEEKRECLEKRYGGDAVRVRRALSRERFVVPEESLFRHLHAERRQPHNGDRINIALAKLEEANPKKLAGTDDATVFRNIDFNSEPNLGKPAERDAKLRHLLEDFADPVLNLREDRVGDRDVIGDAYEFLIGKFAAGAGKKAGEYYTPPAVSELLTRLLRPEPGMRICDPACGSGSLLIRMGRAVPQKDGVRNVALYGMEKNGQTWSLAKMNMFLHEFDQADVRWCDTLRDPALVEDRAKMKALMHFDLVAANPPFSLSKWGDPDAVTADAPYGRFHRGVPPKSRGDFAFISHMIEAAAPETGRVGVICPHGVLFRAGAEGRIRKALIEENLLDAVVGLPPNLFYGTGIPAATLIFDKSRPARGAADVLFIDASRDYADESKQNRLRDEDIEKIAAAFADREPVPRYAHPATPEELAENDYNLNIPRYVDTFEEAEPIDLHAIQQEIDRLEGELKEAKATVDGFLKELGL